MAGVPGIARTIFGIISDANINIIMISQVRAWAGPHAHAGGELPAAVNARIMMHPYVLRRTCTWLAGGNACGCVCV